MKKKPLIGVTRSVSRDYITHMAIRFSLWWVGAKSVRITAKNPQEDLKLDGLILGGGRDIYPKRFNAPIKHHYPYEIERDELELKWLKQAEQQNIPVLGICRGAQLINVHRGGTLHLDVSKAYEKAKYPASILAKIFYRKRMYTNEGSLIQKITQDTKVKVNSIHTQSIDKLGEGLVITAQEENEVVQVIEDPSKPFFMGCQFHPELLVYHKYHRAIFRAFVKAVKMNRSSLSQ